MSVLIIVLGLLAGAYAVALLEDRLTRGSFAPAAPLLAAAALLARESIVTRKPDRLLFETAPVLLLIAALLAAAVLPLSPTLIVADLATGGLFINAALAYVLVALLMAGWGPDGAYAMVGGWRFLGQVIAYSMLIVMPITAVAIRAESLLTTAIVGSQEGWWNMFYQPLGFLLFFIASLAVCFLPPFDRPSAEGELAAGVEAEYTGARLAILRLGRMVLVVSLAAATSVFFLGGWLGPWLPPWVWSALKVLAVAALMLLAGYYLPRVREEHLLAWCWKLGIPLALLNIFIVGVMVLAGL